MTYAIIAAGEGSRLAQEGLSGPKPMVTVNGEMLVDRLIRIFMDNRAERIMIIVNDHSQALASHLQSLNLPVPLQIVINSTPSSFHSFFELVQAAGEIPGELCLTTTDTIFDELEFSNYIRAFLDGKENDGLLAVTSFIDDETPLYVSFNAENSVTAITDIAEEPNPFVSGGIYCLRKRATAVVNKAMQQGTHRMRNFQRLMLQEGLALKAWPFGKILDIDHVADIAKAEDFLNEIKA